MTGLADFLVVLHGRVSMAVLGRRLVQRTRDINRAALEREQAATSRLERLALVVDKLDQRTAVTFDVIVGPASPPAGGGQPPSR